MTSFEGAAWRKASASNGNTNCVEVARAGRLVGVRDSKARADGHLTFTADAWQAFTAAIRSGRYTA